MIPWKMRPWTRQNNTPHPRSQDGKITISMLCIGGVLKSVNPAGPWRMKNSALSEYRLLPPENVRATTWPLAMMDFVTRVADEVTPHAVKGIQVQAYFIRREKKSKDWPRDDKGDYELDRGGVGVIAGGLRGVYN